jgi:predicted aldo/keto reductase-like oxidoreductase
MILHTRAFWRRFPLDSFASGWGGAFIASGRDCSECGECEAKCPYGLPIREMLRENIDFYDQVIEPVL